MRRWLLGAGALSACVTGVVLAAQPAEAYTVRPGDTLWAIAQRNGVSVQDLVRANGISDPSTIYPGEQIAIPVKTSTGTYTVRQGDTLWGIASALGVHVGDLLRLNPLGNPNLIQPGQRLTVPGAPAGGSAPGQSAPPVPPISFAQARSLLRTAAQSQGLNPAFVLA